MAPVISSSSIEPTGSGNGVGVGVGGTGVGVGVGGTGVGVGVGGTGVGVAVGGTGVGVAVGGTAVGVAVGGTGVGVAVGGTCVGAAVGTAVGTATVGVGSGSSSPPQADRIRAAAAMAITNAAMDNRLKLNDRKTRSAKTANPLPRNPAPHPRVYRTVRPQLLGRRLDENPQPRTGPALHGSGPGGAALHWLALQRAGPRLTGVHEILPPCRRASSRAPVAETFPRSGDPARTGLLARSAASGLLQSN